MRILIWMTMPVRINAKEWSNRVKSNRARGREGMSNYNALILSVYRHIEILHTYSKTFIPCFFFWSGSRDNQFGIYHQSPVAS